MQEKKKKGQKEKKKNRRNSLHKPEICSLPGALLQFHKANKERSHAQFKNTISTLLFNHCHLRAKKWTKNENKNVYYQNY